MVKRQLLIPACTVCPSEPPHWVLKSHLAHQLQCEISLFCSGLSLPGSFWKAPLV